MKFLPFLESKHILRRKYFSLNRRNHGSIIKYFKSLTSVRKARQLFKMKAQLQSKLLASIIRQLQKQITQKYLQAQEKQGSR